jgi:hypothetical protein
MLLELTRRGHLDGLNGSKFFATLDRARGRYYHENQIAFARPPNGRIYLFLAFAWPPTSGRIFSLAFAWSPRSWIEDLFLNGNTLLCGGQL